MNDFVIWKFDIPLLSEFALQLPQGAKPLHVAVQHGKPMLWCLVEPDAPRTRRIFFLATTGRPFGKIPMDYIGTFQLEGGHFIGHVFEV
ncbi:MAG TPA: hypothetical protein VFU31_22115, partial [Candidatus Binatia bacterium]|nr:hypothetical protein [Candidatus Binatia bacterium]